MNPTWVMSFPNGYETGTFLALDMGGTNLRVCQVTLTEQKSEFDIIQSKYRMPEELKTGEAEELWEYISDCLMQFIETHHGDTTKLENLPLGFTFSYPATQNYIDEGVLQRWTKGFDIAGVEGHNVVPMFEAALKRRVGEAQKPGPMKTPAKSFPGSTYQADRPHKRHNRHPHSIRVHGHQDEDWVYLRHGLQRSVHGELRIHPEARPSEPPS
jgi:hypothetical protein